MQPIQRCTSLRLRGVDAHRWPRQQRACPLWLRLASTPWSPGCGGGWSSCSAVGCKAAAGSCGGAVGPRCALSCTGSVCKICDRKWLRVVPGTVCRTVHSCAVLYGAVRQATTRQSCPKTSDAAVHMFSRAVCRAILIDRASQSCSCPRRAVLSCRKEGNKKVYGCKTTSTDLAWK